MSKNSATETDTETNSQTMDEHYELDVVIEPDFMESDDEREAPADNMNDYYYGNIAESLMENLYNIAVESDQEHEDGCIDCELPPLPFELNDYPGYEAEEIDLDYKISKIGGLDHVAVNSPMWYSLVRPHLTKEEREELWGRTPWSTKFYWDDADQAGATDSSPGSQLKNRYYIALL